MSMELDIRNIAGIREGEASLRPGVNTVRGLNWQGKSSFVQAIETALGADRVLTEGEADGEVTLSLGGETYRVALRRDGEVVHRDGNPYLDDEYDRVCTRLYACLDDDNPVRAAVRNGDNLEELLTRPLDFADIDARIADLTEERRAVEAELDRAQNAAERLPGVQERVTKLAAELEELKEKRDAAEEGAPAPEGDDDSREELSRARAERSRLEERIERLENTIERTEERAESLRADRDDIDVPDVDVEAELREARERLDGLERDIELVQGLYSANKRILDEERLDLVADVERGLVADELDCWVCGESASPDDIEARVERLGERLASLNGDADAVRERIDELESRRADAETARRERRDLDRKLTDVEETLSARRESLEEARDQLDSVETRIEALADEVAETDERRTDLASEVKYKEAKLEDARDDLESVEAEAERRDHLRERRDELGEEIAELRRRKRTVKQQTREAFDATIGDIVSRLNTSFETARLTGSFDLVVARDGREVSLDALSEGEVELIGLVAALAGYEAYDVADASPVLVLDGLSGLADENLHSLVEYLRGTAEYLVLTAYPEHSSFAGHQIDPADWRVVSDSEDPDARAVS